MFSQNIINGKLIDDAGNNVKDGVIFLNDPESGETRYSTLSNSQGVFIFDMVLNEKYSLVIKHLGFQVFEKKIEIKSDQTIGTIKLKNNELEEILLTSKKSKYEYKVDRKVIRPLRSDFSSNAVELLRNIPSVEVGIRGNIKYRGGGSFKIYINDHPVTNGAERLLQLSAEQIEKIEIISNPSAEYSAEGIAGIISIILKKNFLDDFSLRSNVSTSTLGDLNGYLTANKKFKKFSIELNLTGGKNLWYKATNKKKQILNYSDSTSFLQSTLKSENGQKQLNIGINSAINLSTRSQLGLSFNVTPIDKYGFDQNNGEFYYEVKILDDVTNINEFKYKSLKKSYFNSMGTTIDYSLKINDSIKITAFIDYSSNLNPYVEEKSDQSLYDYGTLYSGYNLSQKEDEIDTRIKYDAKLKHNSTLNFGVSYNRSTNNNYNLRNNFSSLIQLDQVDQKFDFIREVFSAFINYSFAIDNLSIQAGSRLENNLTNLNFTSSTEKLNHKKDEINFFPSIYLLYNFSNEDQLGLNYSKRINRPNATQLAPIVKYVDLYSIYTGNLDLSFYNSHSIELNYKKQIDKFNILNFEIYHRIEDNIIENLGMVNDLDDNILTQQPMNVGNSSVWGAELLFDKEMNSKWNINTGGSVYHTSIIRNSDTKIRKQFSYNFNLNNSFQFGSGWSILYNMNYYGPIKYSQRYREGYFYASGAINKSFKGKNWTIGISSNNIFNSLKFKYTALDKNFKYIDTTILKPYFGLKVSYNLRN